MSIEIKVAAPRILGTGIDGGHSYVGGVTEWKGHEVGVWVFPKDKAEEEKVEVACRGGELTFLGGRHDFVVGVGLSVFDAELVVR